MMMSEHFDGKQAPLHVKKKNESNERGLYSNGFETFEDTGF